MIGSKKALAASKPYFQYTCTALAASEASGLKRIVAPLEPPVFECLSYVPEECQARRSKMGASEPSSQQSCVNCKVEPFARIDSMLEITGVNLSSIYCARPAKSKSGGKKSDVNFLRKELRQWSFVISCDSLDEFKVKLAQHLQPMAKQEVIIDDEGSFSFSQDEHADDFLGKFVLIKDIKQNEYSPGDIEQHMLHSWKDNAYTFDMHFMLS